MDRGHALVVSTLKLFTFLKNKEMYICKKI